MEQTPILQKTTHTKPNALRFHEPKQTTTATHGAVCARMPKEDLVGSHSELTGAHDMGRPCGPIPTRRTPLQTLSSRAVLLG